ncbi:hypothetical protein D3C78_1301090 [compost metagenome]
MPATATPGCARPSRKPKPRAPSSPYSSGCTATTRPWSSRASFRRPRCALRPPTWPPRKPITNPRWPPPTWPARPSATQCCAAPLPARWRGGMSRMANAWPWKARCWTSSTCASWNCRRGCRPPTRCRCAPASKPGCGSTAARWKSPPPWSGSAPWPMRQRAAWRSICASRLPQMTRLPRCAPVSSCKAG